MSRVSHKARNRQFARAIYLRDYPQGGQRCHMLATKSIAIKRRNIYDYPQGETALSRVSHQVHSHQETYLMIIYTVTTHVRVSHQSSAVTRRNIYDYPLGDSELSRVSHQSNVSRDGTSMTIHWVNQSCHVLATKAMMSRDGTSMTIHWVTRSCHVLATKAMCHETEHL